MSAEGFAIWLTGPPAAGKTTLARELARQLDERGVKALVLDSDELRAVLTPAPRYTEEERDWFYGVLAWLAAWLTRQGTNVLVAATAHRRAYRDRARAGIARFAEVYVRCPSEVCARRDPKGLYAGARRGEIAALPGAGVAYEPPIDAEATVDSDRQSPAEAAAQVVAALASVIHHPTNGKESKP